MCTAMSARGIRRYYSGIYRSVQKRTLWDTIALRQRHAHADVIEDAELLVVHAGSKTVALGRGVQGHRGEGCRHLALLI